MNVKQTTFNYSIKPERRYSPLFAVMMLLLAAVAAHFFLVAFVIPQAGFIDMHFPSRYGSSEAYWDVTEFATFSYWWLAIIAASTALVALFTAKKKDTAIMGFTVLGSITAVIYLGVVLGNAFASLFGGWMSVIGVVVAVVVYSIALVLFIRSISYTLPKNTPPKK